MNTATIYDQNAMVISDGMPPRSRCDEAMIAAKAQAKHRGESVVLFDGDDWYQVTRTGRAKRFTARNRRFGSFVTEGDA